MKKLIYVFAAIVTVAFASCAQRAAKIEAEEEAAAIEEPVNVEVVEATGAAIEGDTLVTDTVVGVAVVPAE